MIPMYDYERLNTLYILILWFQDIVPIHTLFHILEILVPKSNTSRFVGTIYALGLGCGLCTINKLFLAWCYVKVEGILLIDKLNVHNDHASRMEWKSTMSSWRIRFFYLVVYSALAFAWVPKSLFIVDRSIRPNIHSYENII